MPFYFHFLLYASFSGHFHAFVESNPTENHHHKKKKTHKKTHQKNNQKKKTHQKTPKT